MPSLNALKTVIRCANFQRSRDFYTRILSFALVEEWHEPHGRDCIFSAAPGLAACLEICQMTPLDPRSHAAFEQPLANDKMDVQLRTASVAMWVEKIFRELRFEGPRTRLEPVRIRLRDPDQLLIATYEERR